MSLEFSNTTDLAGQKVNIAPVFAAFHSAGFSAAHWCHDWIGEPVFYSADFTEQVRQLAEHNSLRVADVHGFGGTASTGITCPDELFLALNINRAEFASRLGADIMVMHLPVRDVESPDIAVRDSIAILEALRPVCRNLGVRLAVENRPRPSHTYAFFDALFNEFDGDYLGFCYDSGHAILTEQADLIVRHSRRLIATHLHDNDGSGDQHRLPGQGKADWPSIINAMKQADYSGTVNLELHLPKDMALGKFCRQAYKTIERCWEQGSPT
ncbi:MAG: sugar phosphate isomerase/epimerase [Planctomycetota bacterium]|nr:sugar phosphate isomerase/epimerase [Planctomycetota bacterium]